MIFAEQQRLPVGFMETVIEYRAYAQTKAMIDAADTPAARQRLPQTDMVQVAMAIDLELAQEAIKTRG